MPTYRFFLFLLGGFAAWLFYLFYVGWFGVFLLVSLLFILVADVIYSIPGILILRVEISAPSYVQRGFPAVLTVKTVLPSYLRVGSLRLKYRADNVFYGSETAGKADAGVCGGSPAAINLPTDKCGCIETELKRVWAGDLLGFFVLPKKCPGAVSTVVLPAGAPPKILGDVKSLSDDMTNLKVKRGGGFAEDHDLREYQEGDPVRSIHWKLSSKMNKAIVREALVPDRRGVTVTFDFGARPEETLDSLKWLCAELLAENIDVSLAWTEEGTVRKVRGINSMRDFDRAMGEILSHDRKKTAFSPKTSDGRSGACVLGRQVRPL